MKKEKMILGAALAAVLSGMTILSSCDPECDFSKELAEGQPATLTLSISSGSTATKTTDGQTQTQDNTVNTIDVFVFRNGGTSSSDNNKLDSYSRFTGGQLSNLQVKTTTGPKTVCVIINSNISSYVGVNDLATFNTLVTSLQKETLGDWVMFGKGTCTMDVSTSLSISVARLISKVSINSIKTNFAGTSYQGKSLTDCKLYLINVHGDKIISSGEATTSPLILNNTKLVAADVNSTDQEGLIADDITGSIGDAGYSEAHTFYCYSNLTTDTYSSTKLVLQAKLDGVTYYYPLPINQDGYGYVSDNGHHGVKNNTAYSYKMIINRPGSLTPNDPISPGTLSLTLSIENWDDVDPFTREY